MSKKALWIEAIVFLAFIFAFFILNTALPDREFSEQENRSLQQRPAFSFDELFSGQYTKDFEAYTTDQFTLRDEWITLKAASELALGKRQNNGMFLCDGGTIIEPYEAPEDGKLEANMEALNKLVANTDADVYFALIPGKSDIWAHMLPQNAPRDSEKAAIDYCYSLSDAVNVDIYGALEAHSGEYIYYRTDHHWTTLGAYYGFSALAESMGLDCPDISEYGGRETVSEEFYGTSWSSSGFSWVEPDSMEIFVTEPEGLEITNYPQGSPGRGPALRLEPAGGQGQVQLLLRRQHAAAGDRNGRRGRPFPADTARFVHGQPLPLPAGGLFAHTHPRPALLSRKPVRLYRPERL